MIVAGPTRSPCLRHITLVDCVLSDGTAYRTVLTAAGDTGTALEIQDDLLDMCHPD